MRISTGKNKSKSRHAFAHDVKNRNLRSYMVLWTCIYRTAKLCLVIAIIQVTACVCYITVNPEILCYTPEIPLCVFAVLRSI